MSLDEAALTAVLVAVEVAERRAVVDPEVRCVNAVGVGCTESGIK